MITSPNKQFIENKRKKSDIVSLINGLSKEQLMPICIEILQKNPEQRKLEDIQIIQAATKDIEFFQQVYNEQGELMLKECLKRMCIEMFDEDDVVFEQGDKPQSFYIILSGGVSVYILKTPLVEHKELELSKTEKIKRRSFFIKKISMGQSFGELAFLNDNVRSASIICDSECILAVLSKKDYKEVLQKAQENKLRQQIKDFHSCLKQHQISPKLLDILFLAFQSSHYQFRQAVYYQGQLSKQEIYLVQSGEFVICQSNDGFYSPKKQTSQIALLQKGQIFGDLESFNSIDKRQQSVFCNSENGVALKIQLSCLIQRLQTTNEMHLYDQLKNICLQKEQVRSDRQQKQVSQDENLIIDMKYVRKRDLTYQVKRVRSARRNTFNIRSPLQIVEDVIKNKKLVKTIIDLIFNQEWQAHQGQTFLN
ncbi:unnamed protein product (macronuclear) [Paramecium tetraurelia]|uniref:Cyclic nucleotide-binding domain-containing protein n=1 Tax=Paramecium tetraurelia TaxID=5888 RepID=A0D7R7_PARTE|nr:uncharacterized protein GSPATT00014051001 [Paramecium tetraurelia]CAK79084.1 unnamed protein product [Paramecium tetraurelia]|eukprot:XP_001446481.1 hypothetical protein (macronuclear) [Paramecium tetraurelia strain d4-2]